MVTLIDKMLKNQGIAQLQTGEGGETVNKGENGSPVLNMQDLNKYCTETVL